MSNVVQQSVLPDEYVERGMRLIWQPLIPSRFPIARKSIHAWDRNGRPQLNGKRPAKIEQFGIVPGGQRGRRVYRRADELERIIAVREGVVVPQGWMRWRRAEKLYRTSFKRMRKWFNSCPWLDGRRLRHDYIDTRHGRVLIVSTDDLDATVRAR